MSFAFSRFNNISDAKSELVVIQLLVTLTRMASS
jgi:hypothetical protein